MARSGLAAGLRPTMRVLLVRHGESEWNAVRRKGPGRAAGTPDRGVSGSVSIRGGGWAGKVTSY